MKRKKETTPSPLLQDCDDCHAAITPDTATHLRRGDALPLATTLNTAKLGSLHTPHLQKENTLPPLLTHTHTSSPLLNTHLLSSPSFSSSHFSSLSLTCTLPLLSTHNSHSLHPKFIKGNGITSTSHELWKRKKSLFWLVMDI